MSLEPTVFAIFENRTTWSARHPSLCAQIDYDRFLEDDRGIRAIIQELTDAGINVVARDFSPEILRPLLSELESAPRPMLWNLTDGYDHYAGANLPAFMRLVGVPHVGSSSYVQMLCQNKHHLKAIAASCGIPVASGVNFQRLAIKKAVLPSNLAPPFFVKPTCFDNSIGDRIAHPMCPDAEQALIAVDRLFDAGVNDVLVEEYLPGNEYTVVAANIGTWLMQCFRVGYDSPGYFSSHAKDANRFTCVAADGDRERSMVAFARRIAEHIGLRDYFRMDFRYNEAGEPRFLEVNSSPFLASFAYNELAQYHSTKRAAMLRMMILQSYTRQKSAK